MTESPYEPPKSVPADAGEFGRNRNLGCCLGTATGGCLIPLILFGFVFARATNAYDLGGPLFWVIIMIPLGLVGGAMGAIFAPKRRKEDHRRFGMTPPKDQ